MCDTRVRVQNFSILCVIDDYARMEIALSHFMILVNSILWSIQSIVDFVECEL